MEDFGEKLVAEGFMSAGDLADLRSDWAGAAADPNAFIYTPVVRFILTSPPFPIGG